MFLQEFKKNYHLSAQVVEALNYSWMPKMQRSKTSQLFRFQLKPSKKYALDFPVNCAITLTDSVFVLASSNDSTIRIFDAIAKKL